MHTHFDSNLVKNLTDAYKKTPDSNNYKILEIGRLACNDLRASLQEVSDILDINNATGKTLDMYGERVGQPRGLATDDKYILMIKAKIMRNLSNGSCESVVRAICATLNCTPSQVVITDGEEPFTISLTALPLDVIAKAGFTTSQIVALIKSMLPVGVSLTTFLFEGTFELAATEADMKVDGDTKGLTDTEANMRNENAIGGYLGTSQGGESDIILPI